MKKRTFNLIATCIATIFALTVIYFTAGLISDRKNAPAQAEQIFDSLVSKTQAAVEAFEPGTYSFSDAFISAAGSFANYQKLSLSYDGTLLYSYPSKDAWYSKKSSAQSFSRTFTDKKGHAFTINAEISTTLQNSLFYRARTAFLVIFLATLTAVLILFFAKADDSAQEKEKEDSEDYSLEDEIDRIVFEDETPPQEIKKEEDFYEPEDSLDTETVLPQRTELQENELQEQSIPQKKYNEQSLEGRCEEALVKAAEDDSDLSILVIKPCGSEHQNISLEQIRGEILNLFDPSDVFFNEDKSTITVVLEKTDLDEAMIPAKKAYEILQEKLESSQITVGISARNNRTISCERLLTEAEEAQKHAATEPDSPIIAFRASPEKYKDLILNS